MLNVPADTPKNLVYPVVATALANMVFPVPGGPYISTPFHGFTNPVNTSGFNIGNKAAL